MVSPQRAPPAYAYLHLLALISFLLAAAKTFAGPRLLPQRNQAPLRALQGAGGGLKQAFFMGKRVDWQPALNVASKAIEVGGEMPLGVRFERRQDGALPVQAVLYKLCMHA